MRPRPDPGALRRAARKPQVNYMLNSTQAIKGFQRVHGLSPDGIVGPLTRAKLRQHSIRLLTQPEWQRYIRNLPRPAELYPHAKTGLRRQDYRHFA